MITAALRVERIRNIIASGNIIMLQRRLKQTFNAKYGDLNLVLYLCRIQNIYVLYKIYFRN